jgi:alpha-glucuronidase
VNNKFTSYYTTQGIQMQQILPYTPQKNGVIERNNRTLKEMHDCMIQSEGLSLYYWVEAINRANYIVNHTLMKDFKNITSEEAWTKIKLDVSHFHVFGSITWDHIPDEKTKHYNLKVRSAFSLDILKMPKVIDFFNLIPTKQLLEEMLNLMKISWPASLIWHLCHL